MPHTSIQNTAWPWHLGPGNCINCLGAMSTSPGSSPYLETALKLSQGLQDCLLETIVNRQFSIAICVTFLGLPITTVGIFAKGADEVNSDNIRGSASQYLSVYRILVEMFINMCV